MAKAKETPKKKGVVVSNALELIKKLQDNVDLTRTGLKNQQTQLYKVRKIHVLVERS